MKNTSNLFKSYHGMQSMNTPANLPLQDMIIPLNQATFPLYSGEYTIEYKVTIAGVEYYNDKLYAIKLTNGLTGHNTFNIGNVISAKLDLVVTPQGVIPKMAEIKVYVRYNGTLGITEWVQFGTYYIDTRKKAQDKLSLECYDVMLKAEKPFIQDVNIPDFPMPMLDAINVITTRLGISLDNPSAINNNLKIEYPNEITMRQVLSYIASANAGNFTITSDNKLKLIVPTVTFGEAFSHKSFEEINDTMIISRITMYYDDEKYYTAGDDTADELVVNNIWATQAMANNVLNKLNGYAHKPYKCNGAFLNPVLELGDCVKVGNIDYIIYNYTIAFTAALLFNISSPGESSIEHEYPYEGTYAKEIKQRVTLNNVYHGVKISRQNGLEISKTDGSAEVVFNSELFAMRSLVGDVMTDAIYFDTLSRKYKISGDVEIASVKQIEENYATKAELSISSESLEIKFNSKLTSYSTTTEMNAAISLSASGLSATFTQQITSTNSKIDGNTQSVAELQLTAQNFNVRISNTEGSLSSLSQTVSGFETRVSNAEGNISTVSQKADEVYVAINNTKVTIDSVNGITVKNGGIRILDNSNREVFGIASNGGVKQFGEFYNSQGQGAVRIYNGIVEIASGPSASWPYISGSSVGTISGSTSYSGGQVLNIKAVRNFKIATDYTSSLSYSMNVAQSGHPLGSQFHEFVGNVAFHGRRFNTTKKFSDLVSTDVILVCN